ncbi:retrovirus-related pol polyprotein from transposon TNT 1-94 [Tanacetum coccineum]
MAFVSSPSSTNELNTAYGVNTANTQGSPASTQVSAASTQLVHEDLKQIHEDDLKEIDLKWQLALLSMRTRRNQDTRNRNQDSSRRTVNMEDTSSKAMLAIDRAGFDWSYMADDQVPTNMALMAFSDSDVYTDKTCSRTCLKSFETLKTQLDDLRIEFNKSEFNLANYKRGLASVEEQLVFYKKNEVIFSDQIAVLKRDISYKDSEISELKSEKGFVSYNDVPPPPTRLFLPPTLNLSNSGLEEFQKPEFEGYSPKFSKSDSVDTANKVRESSDASLDEELVSDDKSQSPRGNQINWNNQKSQQLRSDFVMYNKACFVCGSFDHVQAHYNYHQRKKVVSENNYTKVHYNYFAKKSYPSAHRNMVPRAVLMKTGLRPLNTVRPVSTAHPKTTVYSARPTIIHKKKNKDILIVDALEEAKLLMCDKKNSVLFTNTACFVLSPDFKLPDGSQVLLKVPRKNNMYSVDIKNIVPKENLTCLVAKATLDESLLWHRRLGHVNFKTINKLVKDNLVRGLPTKHFENDQTCIACLKGKQHKALCESKVQNSITQPLFMLYMDLFGLTFVSSLMNKKYCLVVTDDYSRFTWVFFLATKDETSGILKSFITEIENLVDRKVKIIRCDNGTEFKNRVMSEFCEKKGIKREYSIARTPQQNGIAKRRNRTLIEAARTMLADSKLPTTFWAKAVNTACYVHNRVLIDKPHNKTPYELFRGRTPALDFMRPFGCHVIILNTLDYLGKFDGKSDDEFFIGYSLNSKAFRIYNTRTRKVEENLHIRFLKDKPIVAGDGPKWLFDIDVLTKSMNYVPVVIGINSNDFNVSDAEPQPSSDIGKKDEDDIRKESDMISLGHNLTFEAIHDDLSRGMTKSTNEQGFISVVYEGKTYEDLHTCLFAYFLSQEEPKKVTKALSDPDWVEAINKKDKRGIVIRNKVRLVTHGHTQEEGIDYDEVFAPVAIIEAIRLFLAFASFIIFMVYQMDVKSDFLYGQNEEEVYVCQPTRFEDPDYLDKVYKVVKVLYGLHQAPKAWYETLAKYLLDNGFHRGKIDQTLFIKEHKKDILLIQVYVDDIIFSSTKKELCVKQKEDGIFISQDKYVAKILRKFSFTDVRTASTPMDTEKSLLKDSDGDDVDVHLYRSMIGSLMYLTSSRPDIMFAVCACAKFQVIPKVSHLHVVKRIFRYLKGQPKLGLWYPRDSPFDFVAYSDSDYTGSLDKKSTTGSSKYVAAANCCGQVLWIQNEMLDYGYNFMHTMVHIDNNRKPKRTTEISQSSGPIPLVTDENVSKEWEDIMERAATTASSLEAEQASGAKIPYWGGADAQTRFKTASKQSYNPLLSRVNTLRSGDKVRIKTERELVRIKIDDGNASWNEIRVDTARHTLTTVSFWQTATARTLENRAMEITAIIDGRIKTVTEASIRRHLKLEDSDGISDLPNTEIFEQLALMGPKKTAWEQFSSNIATAIICLATNRTFNSSKMIFDEAATMPYDSPLQRVYTLGSGEGSMILYELTVLCSTLSKKVESLESDLKQTKLTYGAAYTKLIMKVKKLENKVKSSKARRRARLVVSEDEDDLEDPSKHRRKIT